MVTSSIQNYLIEALATAIQEDIKNQIAWQIDETTNISCKAQLSIIVQWCYWSDWVHVSFCSDGNGDLWLQKHTHGQTYDGAAVMTSSLNGLQAKVKAVAPYAQFVQLLCTSAQSSAGSRSEVHPGGKNLAFQHFSARQLREWCFWRKVIARAFLELPPLDGTFCQELPAQLQTTLRSYLLLLNGCLSEGHNKWIKWINQNFGGFLICFHLADI